MLLPDPDGSVHGDLAARPRRARSATGGPGSAPTASSACVRTAAYDDPAAVAARGEAEWFMDYRNADGSVSEMCGNGIRVLRPLPRRRTRASTSHRPLPVGTRAGVKHAHLRRRRPGQRRHGRPVVHGETKVSVGDRSWPALHVSMGNPHAVAFVDDLAEAGHLLDAPGARRRRATPTASTSSSSYAGASGTSRCGCTSAARGRPGPAAPGACAVMVAAALADGTPPGRRTASTSPGGRLEVTWTEQGRVVLTGPAVLVARGEWLAK